MFKYSKHLLLLTLLLLVFQLPVFSDKKFDAQDFRKFVKSEMKKWNVPGAAVLLIKDGRVIFSEGFGYRDLGKKLPVDPKTIFPIASCTKTFASFTVGQLVDEGKVKWDAPVRDYFPELMMCEDYVTEHLTVRDVLCHRSGLPRHDRVWMYAGLSRDDLMSRLRYLQPSHGFRDVMQYNNIVYSLSGVVVERVSGTRWEDFVVKRVFKPLGMNSSSVFIADLKKTDNHSLPYVLKAGSVKRIPFQAYNTTGPASCINSNLEDMAKWLMVHINNGQAGGNQLISSATLKEVHAPQMSIPPEGEFKPFICEETPMLSYGLGWVVQPYKDHMMLNHSGGVDGFSTLIAFMPEEKSGVVVLTNLQTNMLPYIIAFNYFDRLYGDKQVDRGAKLKAELDALLKEMQASPVDEQQVQEQPSSHSLKDYAGVYTNPAYGEMKVIFEAGRLFVSYRDVQAPLAHVTYDIFNSVVPYPGGDLNLRLTFEMDAAGRVMSFTVPLQPGVDDISFSLR